MSAPERPDHATVTDGDHAEEDQPTPTESVIPSVIDSVVDDAADEIEEGVSKGFDPPPWLQRYGTAAFLTVSVGFAAYLLRYYLTGEGGPTRLAVAMVPVAYVVAILDDWRRGLLYPRLKPIGSTIAVAVCVTAAAIAGVYINAEFDAIRMLRLGRWNTMDLAAGATLIVLVLEYARRKYVPLFIVNLCLIAYVVYGNSVPGLFRHPGMSWERVVSSMSLETTSGIFESLPQMALTLIGSFILVLAVLRAFGAVDSILKWTSRLTRRSPHLLPQSVVIASASIGMVSGSGAANAATTGTITIPALIRSGMPRVRAAAIETAASLGGQMMPPLMGIAAFLMVNFLDGVSYFDVMIRGFIPAIIYYLGVALAVYFFSARLKSNVAPPDLGRLDVFDRVNLGAYVFAVGGLIYLLGVQRAPAMGSARQVFWVLLTVLSIMLIIRWVQAPGRTLRALAKPYGTLVETFARMTAELTLLLSILGILTAAFTITGVPTKIGFLMLEVAGVNLVAMILLAFVFGYLLGMGLPVAPTYIILVIVISPFMQQVGIDLWSIHFYAFLIAVFGELSPPTSVTAAVTARIADAPFVRTMFRAIELCLPLMVLMVAVFTWPGIIVEPGVDMVIPTTMVLVATAGVTAAVHAFYSQRPAVQWGTKGVLGALSLWLLFAPPMGIAVGLAIVIVVGSVTGFMRTRARVKASGQATAAESEAAVPST